MSLLRRPAVSPPRLVLALVALLLAGACSDEGGGPAGQQGAGPPTAVGAGEFPRVVDAGLGETLRLEAPPKRIVPASASAVDFVLALAGSDRVAAISEVSLPYSPAAGTLADWSEERTFGQFTVEEILAHEPDLVITHEWQNAETVAVLRGAGVPVFVLPAVTTIEDCFDALARLGRALGEEDRAAALVAESRTRMAALADRAAGLDSTLLTYTNFGSGGTVAGSATTFDAILGILGLPNVATELGLTGFGNVDNEWLLAADPDWIVVGESVQTPGTSTSARYLSETEALADLRAVREERVLRMPVHLFNTSSHHLVDAAEFLLDALLAAREERGE